MRRGLARAAVVVGAGLAAGLFACGRISFDARLDATVVDAVDVDVPITTCTTGSTLVPVGVLNQSLTVTQDACNVDNVLALDGAMAGLDRGMAQMCGSDWEPSGSCGCLAVDLGAAYPVGSVVIQARVVAQACSYACLPITNGCGSGDFVSILAGVAIGNYHLVQHVPLTPTLTPYTVQVDEDARYITLCRAAWGEEKDDIEIDQVLVSCR